MAFIIPGLQIVVEPGEVFSGLTTGIGGEFLEIFVASGGTVIDTNITSGYLELDPGAVAIGTVNSGGGKVSVDDAVLSNTLVLNGSVSAGDGGEVINTTLSGSLAPQIFGPVDTRSTGLLAISSGGLATGTLVLSGGWESIGSGGEADGTAVSSGGTMIVGSGGAAIDATIGAGGSAEITTSSRVSNLAILSGGTLFLASGSFDPSNTGTFTVASGGALLLGPYASASLSSYTVNDGVTLQVLYQASTADITVGSGGEVIVNDGSGFLNNVAANTTVLSGGLLVESSGVVSATTISSGGTFIVEGGVASATTVLNGGVEILSGGAIGTTVLSGGQEIIVFGASSATTLAAGAVQIVSSGAWAYATTVQSGGLEIARGAVSGSVVLGGGELIVSSGGYAMRPTVSSGGTLVVLSGAVEGGLAPPEAPITQGWTVGATVLSGGMEIMQGTGSGALVSGGGVEVVGSGGTAIDTILVSGATMTVSSGGLALATNWANSNPNGSGGEIIVSNGGTASGGLVASGAVEIVSSGGTAIGDLVISGGLEQVQSGGLATDTEFYGGTLEVASGGQVGGQVTFGVNSGGSTLILDAGANFQGLVLADFGTIPHGLGLYDKPDTIDLEGIAFGTDKKSSAKVNFTEAASNLSGTLTVTDGVNTASIQLLGSYIASEFVAASDGHGGTAITFTSASTTAGHGHGTAIASPVTS